MDRDTVRNQFNEYVGNFNSSDPKISLKIAHTYRVATLCDEISDAVGLEDEEKDISWVIGMLHDFGRFEQVKRYETFIDSISVDHAELGTKLLFDDNLIEMFKIDKSQYPLIKKAILWHNKYRLPLDLSERESVFSKIIRDADKIDILRVNYETPFEDIYGGTKEELENEYITDAVFDAFFKNQAIIHSIKKTKIDTLIGHASLCFELEYDISREIIKEQGYIYKMLEFRSGNSETCDKLKKIKDHLTEFLL